MDKMYFKQWAERNCPTSEELDERKQLRVVAYDLVQYTLTDETVRASLPFVRTEQQFPNSYVFACVMFALGARYRDTNLEVVYAKPEQPDGSVIPQFTIQYMKPKKSAK